MIYLLDRLKVSFGIFECNGPFTPHDTETDTDKMCTEPIEICIGLGLGPLQPL